jgi:hypothetical protein
MDKIIKLNSIEGGPFTTSQNRMTFEIPGNGVYDLSESYINLNFRVTTTEVSPASGTGVYPVDIRWDARDATPGADPHNPAFHNVSIIKNARLSTANQGQIENIRRVDQLKALMAPYTTSVEEELSRSYHAASQIVQPRNGSGNRWNLYQEINKVGSISSRVNENARVMIPLRDVFDFCFQADEFDGSRAGTTTIHCELNVDKLNAVFAIPNPPNFTPLNRFADAPEGAISSFTMLAKINNLEQSQYFVGQKVTINGTINGAPSNNERIISSIVWNDSGVNEGKLTINVSSPIAVAAGQTYTSITVNKVAPGSVAFELNFGEIIVTQKSMSKTSVDDIEYSTFSTEESNGNGLTSFQRQYQVEPESDAVLISFPAADDKLISSKDKTPITQFRLRLDNEDLTDRNVVVESPLYYDRVNMTMVQMARRLKRLTEFAGSTSAEAGKGGLEQNPTISIMNPLVQKPREKLLQVNTEGTPINEIVLFKHLPRVFSY